MGCSQLCNKVINDEGLLLGIVVLTGCCPDCGGELDLSEDGKFHGDSTYQQCEVCKHFFAVYKDRGKTIRVFRTFH